MSRGDAFRPRSVTKLHLPPCCSLCMPSIHSSSMPISASCGLPSDLMTTPSLPPALIPPLCASYFPFIVRSNRLTLLRNQSLLHFTLISPLSSFHLSPLFPHPPILCQSAVTGSVGVKADCVNVKPFPPMIMFITHGGSRCPWINTNRGSTLQR